MSELFEAEFLHRVKRVYEDCLRAKDQQESGSMRYFGKVAEAAKVLYHLREHLPPSHKKSWQYYAAKCPDYGLLRDVADTIKHASLSDQSRAICNSHQIKETIVITEYCDEEGPYNDAELIIRLNLTDGSVRDLVEVLTKVINFWQDELYSFGLIRRMKNYFIPVPAQPRKREECNNHRVGLSLMKGFASEQSFALQQFNYTIGEIEPVDLTDADIEFRVYKPQYSLEVTAKHDTTGRQISRNVLLFEEEWQHIQTLPTDQEKNAFLVNLPQVRAAYDEILAEVKAVSEA